MKPSAFDYVRPRSKTETLELLSAAPDSTKVLAGGQSLVPMMNFRLARPERLIDINAVPGLDDVTVRHDRLTIGARTRHRRLERFDGEGPLARLLRSAARNIGHYPIRTRGTFGGSLAHSDAVSEWCLVARLLDAEITVESVRGTRVIPTSDFFVSIFTTSMREDELLVEASLPVLSDTHQVGFVEFARRAGDFAIVAAATDLDVRDGTVVAPRICVGGVSDTPFRCRRAEAVLEGADWADAPGRGAAVQEAAQAAAREVSPPSDAHGDAEYRRDLVRTLVARSLEGPPA